MYGRPSGPGPPPAVGVGAGSSGAGPDGTHPRDDASPASASALHARRPASSSAPHGGDASIFSSADGLNRLAKTRGSSSYAGSSHGGSASGSRRAASRGVPRPDPSHPVAYYGEASRAARSSAASQSSGDRHSASDLPDAPTFEVGEDARGATSNPRPGAPARTRAAPEHPSRRASRDHHHPDERRPDERRRKPRGSTPQAWVRVADVIESTRAAESALKRRADEPARLAPTYRDAEAQTEVANLGVGNPNAQLKFQAALQTELRECQDALAEAQMRAKAAARDKERLQAELEEAIARRGAWAKSAPPGGGGGGGGGGEGGDPAAAGDAAPASCSQEEMDDTVNSLLEMITAERDKAAALETHLDRASDELATERDAHHAMKRALAAHKAATSAEFDAQERKLREATEIIGELRQALVQVMHAREGSVAGGQSQAGSDGGRSEWSAPSGRSGRDARGADAAAAAVAAAAADRRDGSAALPAVRPARTRPLSAADLERAKEDARRRAEEAVRRWEVRLEESVDGVVARALDRASRESFGREPDRAGPLATSVAAAVRAALGEAVEAHMAAIVDEMRDRFGDPLIDPLDGTDERLVGGTNGAAASERSARTRPPTSWGAAHLGGSGRERFVVWMTEEQMKRARLRDELAAAQDDLARSEAGRAEATRAWLELARSESAGGGSVVGDGSAPPSELGDNASDKDVVHARAPGLRTAAWSPARGARNEREAKARGGGAGSRPNPNANRGVVPPRGPGDPSASDPSASEITDEKLSSALAPLAPTLDLARRAARAAAAAFREWTETAAFELAWPLLLVLILLRVQLGVDAFAWASLWPSGGGGGGTAGAAEL